jgi:hypothetical protein
MQWHDMKRYHQGKNADGNDVFLISLPTDEDGMIGRECPEEECQPRYFKIALGGETSDEIDNLDSESEEKELHLLYCPYCGHVGDLQEYVTRDQIEWIKSMMVRDMLRTIQGALKKGFGSTHSTTSRSKFSVRLSYRPGRLPSVRHYAEKELKRIVECDQCKGKYAVYGVSAYCPWCGEGNLHLHIKQSVSVIQSLLGIEADIEEKAGKEARYHLVGNCLEDCVGLFEGFLKAIYGQALRVVTTDDDRTKKLKQLRNSFQNLKRAEEILRNDLGWELFESVAQSDRDFMELQFTKRHVITHNLSLVDEKFLSQAQTWQAPGQDVDIQPKDINRLLAFIETILDRLVGELAELEHTNS